MLVPLLGSGYDLFTCTKVAEARRLADKVDLILCGAQFDECRMLDLLRQCKAEGGLRELPFICVRALDGALDNTLYQSVDIASRALGAVAFVDLSRWRERYGSELPQRLRELVSGALRTPQA